MDPLPPQADISMSPQHEPLPPGLSLLWESGDPTSALVDRFGLETFDAACAWASEALEQTWGLRLFECPRLVISDRNAIVWVRSPAGDMVMKWSRAQEKFASLEVSTRILRALAGEDLPVAPPVPTTTGLDRAILSGPAGPLSVTVLPLVPGEWLDVDDRAAVLSAGAELARLHQALGRMPDDVVAMMPEPEDLRQRVTTWLDERDRGLAPEASRRLRVLLDGLPELTDEPHLVHRDFRAANILTRDSEVIGILDFDDVRVDHRVHDLAQACVYLGTLFTAWGPTSRTTRQALREGYESVRPLSPVENRWLDVLVLWLGIAAIPDAQDDAGWADVL